MDPFTVLRWSSEWTLKSLVKLGDVEPKFATRPNQIRSFYSAGSIVIWRDRTRRAHVCSKYDCHVWFCGRIIFNNDWFWGKSLGRRPTPLFGTIWDYLGNIESTIGLFGFFILHNLEAVFPRRTINNSSKTSADRSGTPPEKCASNDLWLSHGLTLISTSNFYGASYDRFTCRNACVCFPIFL